MKRNWIVILSLIAMVIIISHDIIPHYHDDRGDVDLISGQLSHHQDDEATNHNHRNQLPPHQHAFSDGDFLVQRSTISLNKVIKEQQQDYGCFNVPIVEFKTYLHINGSIHEIKDPLNFITVILPCNYTRGSPFIS